MQSLESLKRKISNAEDLGSVVSTMKTLAAVSIRQFETAVESLTDYYATVEDGLRMVLWQATELSTAHQGETSGRTGAIVFGSDQGMCGQFNEQIVNHTLDRMASSDEEDDGWAFLAVGTRAASRLEDAGYSVDHELSLPGSSTGITSLVHDLLRLIDDWRSQRNLSKIILFYNHRHSVSSYVPNHWQLLPVDAHRFERLKQRRWQSRTLPTFTMERDRLFSVLIRQYLFVSLFRACAESLASENSSRIASMQAAERNIEERLAELRANYNQLRQTSITEELLDVITGFEALMKKEP